MSLKASEIHKHPLRMMGRKSRGIILRSSPLGSVAEEAGAPAEADMILWLDAEVFDGVLSNNDPVATWPDLSAHANDVEQATGANQPLWKANQQNGLSAVEFDGDNDFLAKAVPDFGNITDDSDFSFIGIVRYLTLGVNTPFLSIGGGGDYSAWISVTPNFVFYVDTGVANHFVATSFSDTTSYHMFYGDYRASDGRGRISIDNGALVVDTEGASNPESSTIAVGGIGGFEAHVSIGEIIAYDKLLSDEEITALKSYLNNKWAVY